MKDIEEIINKLENLEIEGEAIEDAIEDAIYIIREMELKIEELKDDCEQLSEDFEEYKRYGRCSDYGDY